MELQLIYTAGVFRIFNHNKKEVAKFRTFPEAKAFLDTHQQCPHCGKVFGHSKSLWGDDEADAAEHITYCNPAFLRAEYGESL